MLLTVTIAVRQRHNIRYRRVLRLIRLRVSSRLRLLSVRCLHVFTVHVHSLYQTSVRMLSSPKESVRIARGFEYSFPASYHVILHWSPDLERHQYDLRSY